MRKRIMALASAGVLAATTYVALPAEASVSLASVSTSVTTMVINGDAGCGNRMKVSVKVNQPSSDDSYVSVYSTLVKPDGDDVDFLLFTSHTRSGDVVTYTDNVNLCGFNAPPGKYTLHTEVSWFGTGTNEVSRDSTVYVKRPTSLTYNASPEPVKKGKMLTHSGQLKFDPYAAGSLYGAAGVKLTLSFKRAGTSTFLTKGAITTGKSGKFASTLRADYDGTWRLSLPSNNTRQTQVKDDYVDVR